MSDMQDFEDLNRTDELDRASGLTMRLNAEAERAIRAKVAPERVPDGMGGFTVQEAPVGSDKAKASSYPIPDCVVCGDPIPVLRLQMGRIRCTDCQALRENPRKR